MPPTDLLVRARQLLDLGRHGEAARLARQHLAEAPEDVHGLVVLAVALIQTDQWTEALAAAERVVASDPDLDLGHRFCSIALQSLGHENESVRAAEEAVRVGPHESANFVQLALASSGRGLLSDQRRAQQAATSAVEADPHDANAHYAVGLTAAWPEERRAAYQRALALDPTHVGAANNLVVERDPSWSLTAPLHGFLGVLSHEPDFEEAKENLVVLLRTFVQRYLVAGWVLVALGYRLGDRTGGADRWSPAGAVVGAVALVALIGYAVATYRSVPIGARLFLARAWRTDRLLVLMSVNAILLVAAPLVALIVPGAFTVGLAVGLVLILANTVAVGWTWLRDRRRRAAD